MFASALRAWHRCGPAASRLLSMGAAASIIIIMISRLLNVAKDQVGAAMVEFAIVLPLLLVVLLGIVQFAIFFYQYVIVENAAATGVRQFLMKPPPFLSKHHGRNALQQYYERDPNSDGRPSIVAGDVQHVCWWNPLATATRAVIDALCSPYFQRRALSRQRKRQVSPYPIRA